MRKLLLQEKENSRTQDRGKFIPSFDESLTYRVNRVPLPDKIRPEVSRVANIYWYPFIAQVGTNRVPGKKLKTLIDKKDTQPGGKPIRDSDIMNRAITDDIITPD